MTIRAVATYESSDSANPGVKSVVVADMDPATAGVQGELTVGGAASDARPVAVRTAAAENPYEIEANVTGVTGTGHARWKGRNDLDLAGHTVTVSETVPLASLFQDPDTRDAWLTFSAGGRQGLEQQLHHGPGRR